MFTSKLKRELTTFDGKREAPGRPTCTLCRLPYGASRLQNLGRQTAFYSHERAIRTDRFFEQKICSACLSFWQQKTKKRTHADSKRWQICEQMVFRFFEDRGVPAVRAIQTGPDVRINIFGAIFAVEVKAAVIRRGSVLARPVSHNRKGDDVVAIVMPNDKTYWMGMATYLKNSDRVGFTMPIQNIRSNEVAFTFERAIGAAGRARGLEVADFHLIGDRPTGGSAKGQTIIRRVQNG